MASANIGGSSNDATGSNILFRAWEKKAIRLDDELARLEDLACDKDECHPIHLTIARFKREIEQHLSVKP